MNRERSISPIGQGRFDTPWEPPTPRSYPASPTSQTFESTNGHIQRDSAYSHHHHHYSKQSYNSSAASPTDTATTAATTAPSLTSQPSKQLTPEAATAAQEAVEAHPNWRAYGVSDKAPSLPALTAVANIPIYDSAGRGRMFGSLFDPAYGQVLQPRQLILFVRHFYCGACQAFLKAMVKGISEYEFFHLKQQTQIVIVGCGQPSLIEHYRRVTGCPWPVYADPSRLLFKGLGMSLTLKLGGQPEYMSDVSVPAVLKGFVKELRSMRMEERFQGGNMFQIGGEFLFEEGEVVWCHRMKNMRGHAEVGDIRRVLGLEDQGPEKV